MKTLISMTDFILERVNKITALELANKSVAYAQFLKKPLKLEMFVPCDEGNVLEEPSKDKFEIPYGTDCSGWDYLNVEKNKYYDKNSFDQAFEKYQKAKEKILFEGFIKVICNREVAIKKQHKPPICLSEMEGMTVEHLINYDIELTESAIKQIGL